MNAELDDLFARVYFMPLSKFKSYAAIPAVKEKNKVMCYYEVVLVERNIAFLPFLAQESNLGFLLANLIKFSFILNSMVLFIFSLSWKIFGIKILGLYLTD